MKVDVVTTNLRIPKVDWLQIRAAAGELGMSVNRYINFLIKSQLARRELGEEIKKGATKAPIWQLDKIIIGAGKDLNKDDKTIYG